MRYIYINSFFIAFTTVSLTACMPAVSGIQEARGSSPRGDSQLDEGDASARRRTQPHAGMLRYPDVSATHIVFIYANDIWIVAREGGLAFPLASPPGQETFPRFDIDGETIAFVGNYDGNRDLYTISRQGGVPYRVTHHPASETLCDWTSGGRLLYFTNGFAGLGRQAQLHTVSSHSGLPKKLPVPYGANGAISSDGEWLAYTPHTRDHRTWKRYRGGMATDIWLFNLRNYTSKKITDWEGTDSQPMWHGRTIYYLSDAGKEHRLNIWSYDTTNRRRKQVTFIGDYDVKWPAIGPGTDGQGEIVFQYGPSLALFDLGSGELRTVDVFVPGDRPKIKPHSIDAAKNIQVSNISSKGKRAVLEARGDIWTVPAKHGSPRNLTRSSGTAERDPSWSPDKKWIAYFSDITGEYELFIMQSDGKGETRKLTDNGMAYRYSPTWSPDSKMITFTDKSGAMYVHHIETSLTNLFDTEPWASRTRINWSSDSQWITYTKGGDNRISSVWLYHVVNDKKSQVTAGMFNDSWPTFDRKGDYLYFASNRSFTSPMYEDVGSTFVYADTDILIAVPLRDEVGSPWAPKSDEENWMDDEEGDDEDDDGDDKGENEKKSGDDSDIDDSEDDDKEDEEDEDIKPVEIEIDGFERRAIPLPVKKGNFSYLSVNDKGKLIYVRAAGRGTDGKPAIKIFDFDSEKNEKKEEKTVLEEVGSYSISSDGKKLLVRKDSKLAIVKAAADQKMDKTLDLSGLSTLIHPREEWMQLFNDTWRIQRDFFYDPNMHGVDWDAMRIQYQQMLKDCASREDVTFVIGELISELNVGHAYARSGGDLDVAPSVSVGMLGVDYELHDGAYRITHIYEGAPWDVDARGPLSQPGVDVKVGDYLLAVNGVPVDRSKDPWAAFQGLAEKTVTITVSDLPHKDDEARYVTVELLKNERLLRYRSWIEKNRAYVSEKTGGRVGYIYVPDTGVNGQNNLFRQFYGQTDKQALIIDERWNGGGQIPTRFIELLNRPIANYWARRDGHDWPWPYDAHHGPKCMLINGLAGSGGDYFPWYFKQTGLGKLIGMRTWGGLVGISGNPQLIDGGRITSPTFAFYEPDGTWGIEGHGVDPDIEVIDDPALMVDGGDPQLDRAIDHMLKEIKRNPYRKPRRPMYPNRRGMGIKVEDK